MPSRWNYRFPEIVKTFEMVFLTRRKAKVHKGLNFLCEACLVLLRALCVKNSAWHLDMLVKNRDSF